jgi:predicted ATP-grasp superfamily ATP-dependent carboligase
VKVSFLEMKRTLARAIGFPVFFDANSGAWVHIFYLKYVGGLLNITRSEHILVAIVRVNGGKDLKALVTDASLDFALDIMRCLAKRGVDVYAMGERSLDVSFHSRYCKEGIIGPDPKKDEYVEFLAQTLRSRNIDILIPVGYWSTEKIAGNRTKLDPSTHLEIAKSKSIRFAASKKRTYKLANALGVPYPTTIYPRDFDEVKEISRNIKYPVVIKPIKEGWSNPLYPRTPQELLDGYREMRRKDSLSKDNFPMIQEYIEADSTHNFSALYQSGVCKRVFMWNEIRSLPASGGVGTYSESIYDPKVKEYGLKLLDKLEWHGVANIEFKLDKRDSQFKLMELNPKFWASVEVAIQSGVDFPYLLCEMAEGIQLEYSEEYVRNMKFHWLHREIGHAMRKPSAIPRIVADTFDPKVRSDIQLNDFAPHILEFALPLARLILSPFSAL